jgi:DNA-binding CsgD family transcriptional regulator
MLAEIAGGAAIESAARTLGVSAGTARNHAKAILHKTGCRRRAELMLLLKNLDAAGGW